MNSLRRSSVVVVVGLWAFAVFGCERTDGLRRDPSRAVPANVDDNGQVIPAKAGDDIVPTSSPWHSRAACVSALKSGKKLARSSTQARLASWNLRWFPDGGPGYKPRGSGTDIEWVACAIALLDLDVVAVQEIKTHAGAQAKLAELLSLLDRFTSGKWQSLIDECPQPAGQHVGLLFNTKRIQASAPSTYESINPHREACKNQLRPGYGAHLRFPGGLDLHVISVHLKSGPQRRSLDLRTRSISGFAEAFAAAQKLEPDQDVLILGDFNAMGCAKCSPPVSALDELRSMDAELDGLGVPMKLVPSGSDCSEYHRGAGSLLDIMAVSKSMRELSPNAKLTASGLCGELSCAVLPNAASPAAFRVLSDHCPVYVDLEDRDLD